MCKFQVDKLKMRENPFEKWEYWEWKLSCESLSNFSWRLSREFQIQRVPSVHVKWTHFQDWNPNGNHFSHITGVDYLFPGILPLKLSLNHNAVVLCLGHFSVHFISSPNGRLSSGHKTSFSTLEHTSHRPGDRACNLFVRMNIMLILRHKNSGVFMYSTQIQCWVGCSL